MTQIHPTAIVSPDARLGQDVEIGPFCTVGPQVQLGDGVRLVSHVVIEGATEIGAGTRPSVRGAGRRAAAPGPQGRGHPPGDRRAQHHPRACHHAHRHGGRRRGDQVGSDSLYMVGAHVAHDCVVGDRVTFANNATLGGHVVIGDFVFMGGLCAVHQFTRIGRYSFVGGGGVVTKDIIPYGSVWGNHAHLEGLNLVGLKRRGFTREAINALRAAYRLLFADEGTFQERLDDVAEAHAGTPEVMEIVDFIRAEANRPLCLPEREV
jgi:UDP-N-acetylglucosamine acyltransferase